VLSCELKVNGILVGCIYALNKGRHQQTEFTKYKFEYWRPGDGHVAHGTLLHVADDGIEILIQKILNVCRPIKKEEEESAT
jgi:hypothetical protein